MNSAHPLSRQWLGMQNVLTQLIEQLSPGDSIYTSTQYATAAWQHKLRKWHSELDDLIEEYPLEVSVPERENTFRRSHADTIMTTLKLS